MKKVIQTTSGEKMNEQEKIKRSRLTLVFIAIAFAAPILLAAWMYRVAQKEGVWDATNHGDLIQPPHILEPFVAPLHDGSLLLLENLHGVWSMVYIAGGDCPDNCRQAIYHMRQIRLALGRDMRRVQRLMLVEPGIQGIEEVVAEYPGMKIVFDGGEMNSLRGQLIVSSKEEGIYLIDPLGNVMMLFPSQLDPRDILKDLKKLLRISKIG